MSEIDKIKREIIRLIEAENTVHDILYVLLKSTAGLVSATKGETEAGRIFDQLMTIFETDPDKLLQDMTEPELSEHLNKQLRFIESCHTDDTIGSMLIIFQQDGISQYGATVDPETAPPALRELADRIERRETVKRGHQWN